MVEVLRPRGTGLKRGDSGGFGGTVAACDEEARQSRCAGGRPRRGGGGNDRALWGHGGSECGWESRARWRRGQCSGEQALVASAVKKGERMGMICGPGHVMA